MDNNHTQNFDHLEYTVIRSNRKSICIEISPDLQIKVRAPQKCSIHRFGHLWHLKING